MNTALREAIARKKNPQKYEFERLQRELELQRMQALQDFLKLEYVENYVKEVARNAVEQYRDLLRVEIKQKLDTSLQSFDATLKETITDEVLRTHKELNAVKESIETKHISALSFFEDIKNKVAQLIENTETRISVFLSDREKFRGERGEIGPSGPRGAKGDDGKSVSKETILAELEPVLQSLRSEIKRLAKKEGGGSGGGGMGNIQHETKTVSSITTSVNTTYSVGGGGYAIWAYYQGQLIMRGTHYTVSGKTISLLFTPQDDTFIDIIYMR